MNDAVSCPVMNILGIETSCDETSAAVVRNGTDVLSNIVKSQVEIHAPYGGVVPEIASRNHLANLPYAVNHAMKEAGMDWKDIDAIAATYGPGLASSLMVGLSTAKSLSWRLGKPFIAVDHVAAHIYSAFLGENSPLFEETIPFVALVVSGGHTSLFKVEEDRNILLGQTIDDAAGEAFDKAAQLLGLGYPGGPAIDRMSRGGNRDLVDFAEPRIKPENQLIGELDADLCFSFSGLKTALMYYLKDHFQGENDGFPASVSASFQEAVVSAIVKRSARALEVTGTGVLAVGGGVSLNTRLREQLEDISKKMNTRLLLADPDYCGDNAAMIAGIAASGRCMSGKEAMQLDVQPSINYIAGTQIANCK